MKPGAYGWVWAIPRTSHWTAMACEDAGFAVRDVMTHVFGTGFPKSRSSLKPSQEMWISIQAPHSAISLFSLLHRALDELILQICPNQKIDSFAATAMLQSNEEKHGFLSTVSSWKSILDEGCSVQSMFTIEMESKTIIVLKTLNYCLSQIILENTTQDLQSRWRLNAPIVGQLFDGLRASWQNIPQGLSVVESATKAVVFPLVTEERSLVGASEPTTAPGSEHWILIKAPGELRELRIDECRINPGTFVPGGGNGKANNGGKYGGGAAYSGSRPLVESHSDGRWPANFALSHCDDCADTCVEDCPVRLLDEQSGELKSGKMQAGTVRSTRQGVALGAMPAATKLDTHGDSGGASRFFYQAKPSTKERSLGLPDRNTHPTVKSIALMRHLIRLIAAPGSLVLDPFTGSGSTAVAAIEEGCRFVGIEQDPQHAETARLRVQHALSRR
jgi:hypothetical protein